MNKVRLTIHFPDDYNEDAIDALIEQKYPEADLWYKEREIRFIGSYDRGQELIADVEDISPHDSIKMVKTNG